MDAFPALAAPVSVPVGLAVGDPLLSVKASSEYDAQHGPTKGGLNYSGVGPHAFCVRDVNSDQFIEVS